MADEAAVDIGSVRAFTCTWPASSADPHGSTEGARPTAAPSRVVWQARCRCPRSSSCSTEHTDLPPDDVEHLQRLAGDWQLMSDLSFADLLLWVPVARAAASSSAWRRCGRPPRRPRTRTTTWGGCCTGPRSAAPGHRPTQGRIWREGDPVWYGDTPGPARGDPGAPAGGVDRSIAVVGRDTNLVAAREPGQLELDYLDRGGRPVPDGRRGHVPGRRASAEVRPPRPRVGDGLIRLDAGGKVVYASPNAQSAYRRLGRGRAPGRRGAGADDPPAVPTTRWRAATRPAGSRPRCAGEAPARKEIEARGATVLFRALPLHAGGRAEGALVLVRDMTEVRRRDRQLLSKDATIREIHHRVKNNLQTVAALLRLQARRVESPDARAALEESVRRVASIAMVHETLAMSLDEAVEFDGIVDRLLDSLSDVAGAGDPGAAAAGRVVRDPARGRRDAAGHGAHRARAERGRARVPGGHRQRDGDGHRAPVRPADARSCVADDGDRAAGRLRRWTRATGSACRSSARWSPPSWAARIEMRPRAGGGTEGGPRRPPDPPPLVTPARRRRARPRPGGAARAAGGSAGAPGAGDRRAGTSGRQPGLGRPQSGAAVRTG